MVCSNGINQADNDPSELTDALNLHNVTNILHTFFCWYSVHFTLLTERIFTEIGTFQAIFSCSSEKEIRCIFLIYTVGYKYYKPQKKRLKYIRPKHLLQFKSGPSKTFISRKYSIEELSWYKSINISCLSSDKNLAHTSTNYM